jgi:quinol monooxygenase YgiN
MSTEIRDGGPTQVKLAGILQVPDADIALVEQYLPAHRQRTLAEPGCLVFEVRPDSNDPNQYQVREHFVDRPAFEAHQLRVKNSEWGRVTAHLPRDYSVTLVSG